MKGTRNSRLILVKNGGKNTDETTNSGVKRRRANSSIKDCQGSGISRKQVVREPKFLLEKAICELIVIGDDSGDKLSQKLIKMLSECCSQLEMECAVIAYYNDSAWELGAAVGFDPGKIQSKGIGLILPNCCTRTLESGEPYSFEFAPHRDCYENSNLTDLFPREAYIGYRLVNSDGPFGIIAFFSSCPRAKQFSTTEKSYLKVFAAFCEREIVQERFSQTLSQQRDFEQLVITISTDFINLPVRYADSGIQEALKKIASFAGVDYSYIFLFKDNNEKMDIAYWWISDQTEPRFRLKDVSVDKYKTALLPILKREVVDIPDLKCLPENAAAEKRFAASQGVQSAILVPMVYAGCCIGLVGFASRKVRKNYDVKQVKLLKMVGHIFASAVEYKRAHEAMTSLEQQMLQAQKLESLGILAGGIAHDFNNMLMGVIGNAGLALDAVPTKSPARIHLKRIEKISQKAADLTNQLLAYAGKGKFSAEVLNTSSVLNDLRELLEAIISKKHALRYNLTENIPAIEGDLCQISQVVINLVTNASDAIGNRAGIILINTGLIAVDSNYLMGAYFSPATEEGVYVYLEVCDDGCGMERAICSRIFDPFFTTKPNGHGLGLAAVLGIVRAHGGTVKVNSEVGKGTKITVLFPCAQRQELQLSRQESTSCLEAKHEGLVLVIDDEDWVRECVSDLLKQSGFKVLSADSGTSALQIFRETAGRINAVVLDMSMPDIEGWQVFDQMCAIQPKIKVILSSGYNEQQLAAKCAGRKFAGFLQKPYLPQVLMRKIVEILTKAN